MRGKECSKIINFYRVFRWDFSPVGGSRTKRKHLETFISICSSWKWNYFLKCRQPMRNMPRDFRILMLAGRMITQWPNANEVSWPRILKHNGLSKFDINNFGSVSLRAQPSRIPRSVAIVHSHSALGIPSMRGAFALVVRLAAMRRPER